MAYAAGKRMAEKIRVSHREHAIVLNSRQGDAVSLAPPYKRFCLAVAEHQPRKTVSVFDNVKAVSGCSRVRRASKRLRRFNVAANVGVLSDEPSLLLKSSEMPDALRMTVRIGNRRMPTPCAPAHAGIRHQPKGIALSVLYSCQKRIIVSRLPVRRQIGKAYLLIKTDETWSRRTHNIKIRTTIRELVDTPEQASAAFHPVKPEISKPPRLPANLRVDGA